MKIGERTVSNALFNAVSGMLPLVLSFIFWPYIVDRMGVSPYGIFALVGTVIGYFALLDLGLGNAVVKYVAEYAGQKDDRQMKETIGVSLSVFVTAGLVGSLLIIALTGKLVTDWLKIPPELTAAASHAFYVAALGFLFTMLLTLFTSVINGLNRYDISSITMAVMGVASTIGSVVLLSLGFGLVSVVWLNVAATMLAVLFYFVVIRRLLPDIPLRFRADRTALRRILHFGLYTMLSRITDVILSQLSLLIIGTLLGVSYVTFYVIPFTILNRLTTLIGRAGMVVFPAFSELQGQQRPDVIRELYITASRIIISFAAAITVPLLVFGVRFLALWMGPQFAEHGGAAMLLITLGVFFNQSTNVPTFAVNGLGRPKISGLASLANAGLFLGLMIPGAVYAGITGVAAAFTVSALLVSPAFVWYVNSKVLELSFVQLMKDVYMRPLLAGLAVAGLLLMIPQDRIHNLFQMLLVMGASMGLYFMTALLSGVYQERERKVLMDYLGGVIIRVRTRRVP